MDDVALKRFRNGPNGFYWNLVVPAVPCGLPNLLGAIDANQPRDSYSNSITASVRINRGLPSDSKQPREYIRQTKAIIVSSKTKAGPSFAPEERGRRFPPVQ